MILLVHLLLQLFYFPGSLNESRGDLFLPFFVLNSLNVLQNQQLLPVQSQIIRKYSHHHSDQKGPEDCSDQSNKFAHLSVWVHISKAYGLDCHEHEVNCIYWIFQMFLAAVIWN